MLTHIEQPFDTLFLIVSNKFIVIFTFSTAENCFRLLVRNCALHKKLFENLTNHVWIIPCTWTGTPVVPLQYGEYSQDAADARRLGCGLVVHKNKFLVNTISENLQGNFSY